jgi:hypothetical protein
MPLRPGGNHSMANNARTLLASGKAVMNGWLVIPSGLSAEIMAQCGFVQQGGTQ